MATPAVHVRMYNVGFGDCFLLRFVGTPRDRLMLIDCGVHSASQSKHELATVIGDIIKTATEATGSPRLDVVVATHRHRDHVHGFRDPRWTDVEVGEVWLPWTEDPDDEDARRIKDRQSRRAQQLARLAVDANDPVPWAAVAAIAENNDEYKNALAMAMLHEGFAGTPVRSYLPQRPGRPRARALRSSHLPGVAVEILGPSRSEAVIRDLEPPADEMYVGLDDESKIAKTGRNLPFESWLVPELAYRREFKHLAVKPNELGTITNLGKDDALGLAVALEDAVNGTSLMLMLRYRGVALLFAGDAEWGTWDALLGDREHRERLAAIDLYKVSHHGSRNGTPSRFVELERSPGIALVPVGATAIPSWQGIPRKPLLKSLEEHGLHVVRADHWQDTAKRAERRATAGVSAGVTIADDGLWTEVALAARDV